jgi:hypothetical protein
LCKDNNLSLNVIKTKEMIVEHAHILIDGAGWSRLRASSSLASTSRPKTVVKRAQQNLSPLPGN